VGTWCGNAAAQFDRTFVDHDCEKHRQITSMISRGIDGVI